MADKDQDVRAARFGLTERDFAGITITIHTKTPIESSDEPEQPPAK